MKWLTHEDCKTHHWSMCWFLHLDACQCHRTVLLFRVADNDSHVQRNWNCVTMRKHTNICLDVDIHNLTFFSWKETRHIQKGGQACASSYVCNQYFPHLGKFNDSLLENWWFSTKNMFVHLKSTFNQCVLEQKHTMSFSFTSHADLPNQSNNSHFAFSNFRQQQRIVTDEVFERSGVYVPHISSTFTVL